MRMKSYFANTVEAAMGQARAELGPEAALVTSRAAGPEARHLGQYEVVFAADLPGEPPTDALALNPPTAARQDVDRLLGELRELRERVDSLRHAPVRAADIPVWALGDTGLERAWADMLEAEIEPAQAARYLAGAAKRLRPAATGSGFHWDAMRVETATLLDAALYDEIEASFSVNADLGEPGSQPRVAAIVGPPGAGKTAITAKLATRYALNARRPSALISLDAMRVAAGEQLRWYASILGMAYQSAGTAHELGQVLEEHRNKDLILIDAAGYTVREIAAGAAAASCLARHPNIQVHLALPATLRAADLARVSDAYRAAFNPTRLIFTHVDEACALGPMLCEAVRSGLPVSFLGTGQRVPEDFEPASAGAILERVFPARQRRGAALSAA